MSCTASKKASTPLTRDEAAQAIRQVLNQGLNKGVSTLSKHDGFSNNKTYKLDLPPGSENLKSTFQTMGMQPMTDRAISAINHSAEDAVGYAGSIFSDAINKMTIDDPIAIVNSNDSAATLYFKANNHSKLINSLIPIVKSSMDKFSVPKYYNDLLTNYKGYSENIKLSDLNSYVALKIANALFDQMEQHEVFVRNNRAARNTDALKKTFGKK